VDARSADSLRRPERDARPVAGHIPVHATIPFSGNLDAHGRFLSAPSCGAPGQTRWRRPHRRLIAMWRLRRHGLPQSARAHGRWTCRRATLRGVVERVDPRSGAPVGGVRKPALFLVTQF